MEVEKNEKNKSENRGNNGLLGEEVEEKSEKLKKSNKFRRQPRGDGTRVTQENLGSMVGKIGAGDMEIDDPSGPNK